MKSLQDIALHSQNDPIQSISPSQFCNVLSWYQSSIKVAYGNSYRVGFFFLCGGGQRLNIVSFSWEPDSFVSSDSDGHLQRMSVHHILFRMSEISQKSYNHNHFYLTWWVVQQGCFFFFSSPVSLFSSKCITAHKQGNKPCLRFAVHDIISHGPRFLISIIQTGSL